MRRWPDWLRPAASLLVCCAPLFVLTARSWPHAVLFSGGFLALLLLWRGHLPEPQPPAADRAWAGAMVLALLGPIVAVALSAGVRGDSDLSPFDAPSRFLLGIPIFLFVLRARVDAARILGWALPLALLAALASLHVLGRATRFPQGRDTTTVVDPLVFGYLSLAFGLMCLISMSPRQWKQREWASLSWRAAAVALGFYLSLRSGSRTGWAAVPIVVGAWLYLNWGRGHPGRSLVVLLSACAAPLLAYLVVPTVQLRFDQAWREVVDYTWTGVAPYTSVGLRITFLRIAAETFAVHSWTGMGDTSHLPMGVLPTFRFASPEALEGAFHAAFHNQVVSNGVRYGVGGLVSTLALLLVPLTLCVRQLRRAAGVARESARMGFAYSVCMVVSSLSTEVVDLKFLASFYTVMVAVLCGAALADREPPTGPAS